MGRSRLTIILLAALCIVGLYFDFFLPANLGRHSLYVVALFMGRHSGLRIDVTAVSIGWRSHRYKVLELHDD